MKKICVLLLAVLTLGVATPALAEIEVSGDAYVSVNSMYLWRGFDLSNSDPVVQPGMDVSVGDVTFSYWSNFDFNTGELNETDIVIDYSTSLGELLSVSVGNIFYSLDLESTPDTPENVNDKDTNELYLSLGLATLLEPALTVYYDYDAFDGNIFTTLSVGHGLELADNLSVSAGALASYFFIDEEQTGTDDSESFLHNGELSLAVDYALNEQVSISPAVIYSTPLSNDAEDIAGIDDEFMGGVTVTLTF